MTQGMHLNRRSFSLKVPAIVDWHSEILLLHVDVSCSSEVMLVVLVTTV